METPAVPTAAAPLPPVPTASPAATPEGKGPVPPAGAREVTETVAGAFTLATTEAAGKTGRQCEVAIIQAGTSKNRNIWKPEVLTKALPLFEGAKVYVDHKGDWDRSARELVGQITGVRMAGETMVGTLTSVNNDVGRWFRETVTDPLGAKLLGLSVYVYAYSKQDNAGCEEMVEIATVRSVDVVHDASAGGGILAVTEGTKPAVPAAVPEPVPAASPAPATEAVTTPPTASEGPGGSLEPRKEAPVTEQEIKAIQERAAKMEADNVKLRAEAQAQSDRLARLEAARVTDEAIASARAAGKDIKPAAEAQIRAGLSGLGTVTAEIAAQVVETVLAQAAALVKEYTPVSEGAGIPPAAPVNEAAVKEAKRKVQLAAVGYIFSRMGIDLPDRE